MIEATIAPGSNGREASVRKRYSAAARAKEDSLCCPVSYSREYLDVIPEEILQRDYGCGDPTPHVRRGERMAVCDKTSRLLQREPYAGQFEFIEPRDAVPLEKATRFDCSRPKYRPPRETKGQEYDATTESAGVCTDGGNCC